MLSIHRFNPTARAVGVVSAVAVLAGGVTYAALQSQATLTNNTIASATASLTVRNTDIPTEFGASETGFNFTGIVPGGADSNTGHFQLQNGGSSNLALNVVIPSQPTWTVTPPGSVDNTKVNLILNCTSGTSGAFSLTDNVHDIWFNSANISGGPLKAGDTADCTAKVSMTSSAFTGSSASSSTFDLKFTGTGV